MPLLPLSYPPLTPPPPPLTPLPLLPPYPSTPPQVHLDRLHAPLQATVDYFGFRVLCVSKLPTERVIFTDDGDVRRISEQLVRGRGSGLSTTLTPQPSNTPCYPQ